MTLRDSWPSEKEAQLRQLWAEGHSGRVIAKMMGLPNRNHVMGKVHRLGLPTRGEWIGAVRDARRAANKAERERRQQERARKAAMRAAVIVIYKRRKPLPPASVAPMELPDLKIPFADRTQFQCAWIAGEPNM